MQIRQTHLQADTTLIGIVFWEKLVKDKKYIEMFLFITVLMFAQHLPRQLFAEKPEM